MLSHFSHRSFRFLAVLVPCHWTLFISVTGPFGSETFWSRFNRPKTFWTSGHSCHRSFRHKVILLPFYFGLVSLQPRTFRYWVMSMPYHFGSWLPGPGSVYWLMLWLILGSVYVMCNVHSVDAWCGSLWDYVQGWFYVWCWFLFCIRTVPQKLGERLQSI